MLSNGLCKGAGAHKEQPCLSRASPEWYGPLAVDHPPAAARQAGHGSVTGIGAKAAKGRVSTWQ